MKISDCVKYVGVNDHKIDLFEGMYKVPDGISYNSYVIIDEKIAVMDAVDNNFAKEWLSNVEIALNGRTPDYLVVHHMEPDHSGSIVEFTEKYPSAKVVSSSKSFVMMKNYFGNDFDDRQVVVGENDKLSLGEHQLTFVGAPMVHWPEVLVSYEEKEKTLFSADGFGKFGALDVEDEWACEARRYYFGIVGKYGVQVQALLKKASALQIERICPLHGPILDGDLSFYFNLYDIWSKYEVESEGVLIAYTSVYGNTKKAVEILEKELQEKGLKVAVTDLARDDMAEAVEDGFRYGKIVLATTTYNGDIFPFMREYINNLVERGFKNKKIGFIENGSWAPVATRKMSAMLEECKNLTFAENNVKILSAVSEENLVQLKLLAEEMSK